MGDGYQKQTIEEGILETDTPRQVGLQSKPGLQNDLNQEHQS
jgi:hypothetical protein